MNHCMASCHSGHAQDLEAETDFPMLPALIEKEQKVGELLMKGLKKNSKKCRLIKLEGHEVIGANEKVCIPKSLQGRTLSWHHECSVHPGTSRTEATIRQTLCLAQSKQGCAQFCHNLWMSKTQKI